MQGGPNMQLVALPAQALLRYALKRLIVRRVRQFQAIDFLSVSLPPVITAISRKSFPGGA